MKAILLRAFWTLVAVSGLRTGMGLHARGGSIFWISLALYVAVIAIAEGIEAERHAIAKKAGNA